MSFEECIPIDFRTSLWCRVKPVAFSDIIDGRISYSNAQVWKCPDYPITSPWWIFLEHPQDQLFDIAIYSGSALFSFWASLFLWESLKAFGLPPSCSIKICLSLDKYSITACWCRFTQPAIRCTKKWSGRFIRLSNAESIFQIFNTLFDWADYFGPTGNKSLWFGWSASFWKRNYKVWSSKQASNGKKYLQVSKDCPKTPTME